MIEMGKEYRTKEGRTYRLLAVDGGGDTPVIGLVQDESDKTKWISYRHKKDGTSPGNSHLDLIEVKPRIKGEFWVVHTSGGNIIGPYPSKPNPNGLSPNTIAVTHHTYDCVKGEGLE